MLLHIQRLYQKQNKGVSEFVPVNAHDVYPIIFAKNKKDLSHVMESIVKNNWVDNPGSGSYRLTTEGYERLEDLENAGNKKRKFQDSKSIKIKRNADELFNIMNLHQRINKIGTRKIRKR